MAENTEIWKNASLGRVGVLKLDRRGDYEQELVKSGGNVILTVEERAVNQHAAADESLDVFKNGTLVPVRLLDTSEDAAEIASNPNLRSESELRDMFKLQWKKFETEVATVNNPLTLQRLKEIAQEGDATVRQVNVIEARLAEIDPEAAIPDVVLQNYGNSSGSGAVMPVR